mmetsp:Transcript_6193/g.12178  ORF Transcript_6193/g.12178 Transcript_6193/m.12178 type:complete len:86 (-) Transcript_6193:4159-4416(-)
MSKRKSRSHNCRRSQIGSIKQIPDSMTKLPDEHFFINFYSSSASLSSEDGSCVESDLSPFSVEELSSSDGVLFSLGLGDIFGSFV